MVYLLALDIQVCPLFPRVPFADPVVRFRFARSVLLRASVMNALVMIQPALLSYSLNQQGPPQPVLLDAQALKV